MPDLTLSEANIIELTGYTQASRQLDDLHDQGFWRARLRGGRVVLEWEHYRAVCAGATPPARADNDRPKRKSERVSA